MFEDVYRYLKKEAMSLLFLLPAVSATAQENAGWESYISETATCEDLAGVAYADMYDVLSGIAEHPININTATREDLEQLPFLSDSQIKDICDHIRKYGAMKTTAEINAIGSLDDRTRRLLAFFIYAGKGAGKQAPTLKEMLAQGKNSLTAMASIPTYKRKGDFNIYRGYQYKHWMRYGFSYRDRLEFGIIGSQDAGEQFFYGRNSLGYDYYSYYLVMRKIGRIETLALGKYRLSYGMGLVVNSGLRFGKTVSPAGIGRSTNAIRPHSSRSEAGYFNGAAATVRLSDRFTAGAFASYRPLDATLNDDGTVKTIIKTGYHRTDTEIDKKHNTHAATAGGSLRYSDGGLHAGITAVYTHLDRDLRPDTKSLFRYNYPAGNDFANIGIDYGYTGHRLSLSGETATDKHGAVATVNAATLTLTDVLRLTALQRFYSFRYTALHANSFSDGGRVNNESGIYLGADWTPSPRLSVSAYTDFAYFAWPTYRASQSSHSWDNLLTASYRIGRWTLAGRYRMRLRERDNKNKTDLTTRTEQRARVSAAYDGAKKKWGCKVQGDMAITAQENISRGWMGTGRVYLNGRRAGIDLETAYFRTDDYDSRVYFYERGMQYTFSCPAFYGHGFHTSLAARADIGRRLTLRARIGTTKYFDRNTIGSDLRTIYSSAATDVDLQARVRF